jgi:UDP-N-acetylmuramate dehydrogenase
MQMQHNVSLKPYNTFGIDVMAKCFATFNSIDELEQLLNQIKNDVFSEKLFLGGGSNILFTKNFDGYILKNELKGIEIIHEDEKYVYLKAAAGEVWHELVMYCVDNNFNGIENLSLIPGNVGASPMQNIGAYGVEIKDIFHSLEAYHIEENIIVTFDNADCEFGYRESIFKKQFKNQFIILNVTFKLSKQPHIQTSYGVIEQELANMGVKELSNKSIAQAVINIRSSKLPNPQLIGNAGSFFKNPTVGESTMQILLNSFPSIPHFVNKKSTFEYKIPAAWLIEQCGWKGYRNNDAGCHINQPLVLVNYGNASGNEIFELSTKIIETVKNKFNIILEREVNII